MSYIIWCFILVYDDVWVMMLDDVRNIYSSMYDVLDMPNALYGDMMSMMITWRLY